jgi:FkbM family methyltransferase
MKNFIKNIINQFGYELHSIKEQTKIKDNRDPFLCQRKLLSSQEKVTIFDVGGYHGLISIAYHNLFPQSNVYTFEPFEESFHILEKNIQDYPSIKPYKVALSDKIGENSLHINQSAATNSLLASSKTGSPIDTLTASYKTINIKTDTIDNMVVKHHIDRLDILKLDIQGGEIRALQGAAQMLSEKRINLIYCEVEFITIYESQPLYHHIATFLQNYGYQLFDIFDFHHLENKQLAWADAIFYNPETIKF